MELAKKTGGRNKKSGTATLITTGILLTDLDTTRTTSYESDLVNTLVDGEELLLLRMETPPTGQVPQPAHNGNTLSVEEPAPDKKNIGKLFNFLLTPGSIRGIPWR